MEWFLNSTDHSPTIRSTSMDFKKRISKMYSRPVLDNRQSHRQNTQLRGSMDVQATQTLICR